MDLAISDGVVRRPGARDEAVVQGLAGSRRDGDEWSRGCRWGHVRVSENQRRFERPPGAEDGGVVLLGFGCEG